MSDRKCNSCGGDGWAFNPNQDFELVPCSSCSAGAERAAEEGEIRVMRSPQPERTAVTVMLTDREIAALDELAAKQELSRGQVLVGALRVYQLVATGHSKLVEVDPLPMRSPEFVAHLGPQVSDNGNCCSQVSDNGGPAAHPPAVSVIGCPVPNAAAIVEAVRCIYASAGKPRPAGDAKTAHEVLHAKLGLLVGKGKECFVVSDGEVAYCNSEGIDVHWEGVPVIVADTPAHTTPPAPVPPALTPFESDLLSGLTHYTEALEAENAAATSRDAAGLSPAERKLLSLTLLPAGHPHRVTIKTDEARGSTWFLEVEQSAPVVQCNFGRDRAAAAAEVLGRLKMPYRETRLRAAQVPSTPPAPPSPQLAASPIAAGPVSDDEKAAALVARWAAEHAAGRRDGFAMEELRRLSTLPKGDPGRIEPRWAQWVSAGDDKASSYMIGVHFSRDGLTYTLMGMGSTPEIAANDLIKRLRAVGCRVGRDRSKIGECIAHSPSPVSPLLAGSIQPEPIYVDRSVSYCVAPGWGPFRMTMEGGEAVFTPYDPDGADKTVPVSDQPTTVSIFQDGVWRVVRLDEMPADYDGEVRS